MVGCHKAISFKQCDEPSRWVRVKTHPYYSQGTGISHKKQCLLCGACGVLTADYPPTGVEVIDEDKSKEYENQKIIERQNQIREEIEVRKARKEEEHLEWKKSYNRYLNSEVWKDKRGLILQRDKNICQSCLKRQATEVHHMTYDSYNLSPGSEPAWELISICRSCHERQHA